MFSLMDILTGEKQRVKDSSQLQPSQWPEGTLSTEFKQTFGVLRHDPI